MKYNKIDRCRFSKGRRHLLELTKAYGLKHVEVLKNGESTPVNVLLRTYVFQEFKKLRIPFDDFLTRKENWKPRHQNLSVKQMTVIMLRAFIDMKKGYIEDYTPECDEDEERISFIKKSMKSDMKYLKTFSEYDNDELTAFPETECFAGTMTDERKEEIDNCKKWLRAMNISAVTVNGINEAFWTISQTGIFITHSMRDALVSLTDNQELRDYIDYCCDKYNWKQFSMDELMQNNQIKNLKKTYIGERLEKKKEELNSFMLKYTENTRKLKEKNLKIAALQKELAKNKRGIPVRNLKKEITKTVKAKYEKKLKDHNRYKGVLKFLRTGLLSPGSKMNQLYDLNKEDDMILFLRWFEHMGKTLPKSKISYVVRNCIEDEAAAERFCELVNEMNERITEKS